MFSFQELFPAIRCIFSSLKKPKKVIALAIRPSGLKPVFPKPIFLNKKRDAFSSNPSFIKKLYYKLYFNPKVKPRPLIPTYELNSSIALVESNPFGLVAALFEFTSKRST